MSRGREPFDFAQGRPRALWLMLLAIAAGYAVFASVVSVSYTAVYGLSRWTLRPDTTAIFPFLLLINLFTWVGYGLWAPAIFWLGRRFRFDRRHWLVALAVHVPASLIITSLHLALVGVFRFYLQSVRGGDPDLGYTIAEAFFRTVDLELPVYWAIIGLQHAVDYYRQARARELRAARLEVRLVQAQLQALQQQLHPHFLFNTLHAISTLVHRDPDKADAMIERLSDLLRITLHKVGVQEVELAEELEYLRAYLDIEQVHFGPRLLIDYRIDVAALDVMVPTLILQPLVENAIRHGLEPQVRGGSLTIEAQADGDTLWLRVRDNGVGFAKGVPRRDGLGLSNTRSRLDRLYGEQAALTIRENPGGGVLVDLYLPLRRAPAFAKGFHLRQGSGGQVGEAGSAA
ncbi:MAG TPA: histidine kinase [Vicinamibacterales bacterium]|nr:histidine kinase [Vicinamibacterales bacterium]